MISGFVGARSKWSKMGFAWPPDHCLFPRRKYPHINEVCLWRISCSTTIDGGSAVVFMPYVQMLCFCLPQWSFAFFSASFRILRVHFGRPSR